MMFTASMIMMLVGSFHIMQGLAAVLNDSFYVVRPGYDLELNVTTWGWLHMAGGILIIFGSIGLLMGSIWARVLAIVMAVASAIWSFYSIPYYPVWSILVIALDIGVLWALTTHGHDLDQDTP
jgi:hypothetical protein